MIFYSSKVRSEEFGRANQSNSNFFFSYLHFGVGGVPGGVWAILGRGVLFWRARFCRDFVHVECWWVFIVRERESSWKTRLRTPRELPISKSYDRHKFSFVFFKGKFMLHYVPIKSLAKKRLCEKKKVIKWRHMLQKNVWSICLRW